MNQGIRILAYLGKSTTQMTLNKEICCHTCFAVMLNSNASDCLSPMVGHLFNLNVAQRVSIRGLLTSLSWRCCSSFSSSIFCSSSSFFPTSSSFSSPSFSSPPSSSSPSLSFSSFSSSFPLLPPLPPHSCLLPPLLLHTPPLSFLFSSPTSSLSTSPSSFSSFFFMAWTKLFLRWGFLFLGLLMVALHSIWASAEIQPPERGLP